MNDLEIEAEIENNKEYNSNTPSILHINGTIDILIDEINEVSIKEANSTNEVFITYQSANW
ncbi:MAG: hypothetical protein ACTTIS_00880 [Streptobacillus sp.]|nr:MAG TPA: hypothetical protein [Caudoviricetes sp.]